MKLSHKKVWSLFFLAAFLIGTAFLAVRLHDRALVARSYGEARSMIDAGKEEQAIKLLEQLLSKYPEFEQAYISEIALAYDMEDPRLEEYINKAQFVLKDNDEAAQILAAINHFRQGESQKGFDILLQSKSANPDLLAIVAEKAMDLGRFSDAKRVIEKCRKADTQSTACEYDDLMLNISENDFSEVERKCTGRGNDSWSTIPCALADLGLNRPSEARKKFEDLGNIVTTPGRFRRLTARAWQVDTFIYQGQLGNARALTLQVAVESFGEEFTDERRYELAKIAFWQGDKSSARELAERLLAVVTDPEIKKDTLILLAELNASKETGSEQLPGVSRELIASMEHRATHSFEEAVADLEKAYEADSRNTEVAYELAINYMLAGQTKRAVPLFESILQHKGRAILNSDSYYWIVSHYKLGNCYEEVGDPELARKAYREFLSLWKDADKNLKFLKDAQMRLARLR
jgi:tetratricopeptide (TPR) repeat protein